MEITQALKNIEDIRMLKKDWNLYNADPISNEICDLARQIVLIQVHIPEVFPTANRSIQLEWHKSTNEYLECEIQSTKIIMFMENNKQYYETILSISRIDDVRLIVDCFYDDINKLSIQTFWKNVKE